MLRLLFLLLLTLPMLGLGQERFFLQPDKRIAYGGDTIWFKAYIDTESGITASTNFYVEIFDEQDLIVCREIFRVENGQIGFGQVAMPTKAGPYWLRGYTFNSVSEVIIPVNVIGPGEISMRRTRQKIKNDSTISISKVEDRYSIHIGNSVAYNYSISVTDTADPGSPLMLAFGRDSSFERKWDTSWLSYRVQLSNVKIRSRVPASKLFVYAQYDSISSQAMLPLDKSGNVEFPNMDFYNTCVIHYKLTGKENPSMQAPVLKLYPNAYPPFIAPSGKLFITDTLKALPVVSNKANSHIMSLPDIKNLKAVEVKAKWRDRHLALDKRYVISDAFKHMEHFTFDLRHPDNPGRIHFVLEYLQSELPANWASNTLTVCREGIRYFVDDQPVSAAVLAMRPLSEFAYAKIFQDLLPPCPSVCLYTRKGVDLQDSNPESGVLTLKGYTKPMSWSTPDRITWLWEPYLTSKEYTFFMPMPTFKIVLSGTTADGKPLYYEKIVRDGKF